MAKGTWIDNVHLTDKEYAAYEMLKRHKSVGAISGMTGAMNRLVKKGLAVKSGGGWRIADGND